MTTPISPTQRLAQVSREYAERAQEYAQIATEAAVREANYRRVKAQTALKAIADGASAAKAEMIADADETVATACLDYKTSAAVCDAASKRLTQLREQVATGRTLLVSERESDRIHAETT